MSETTFSLPVDVTPAKARELVAGELGKLAREVGSLRQAVSDRDRVISTLKATTGDQAAAILRMEDTIQRLRDSQRGGADPALRAELAAWRGVVEYGLGRVVALLEDQSTIPDIDAMEATVNEDLYRQPATEGEPLPQPLPHRGEGGTAARQCCVEWCARPRDSKDGYCASHKARQKAHGDAMLIKRRLGGVMTLCRETGRDTFQTVEVTE
jgi:hypothetical protein